MRCEANGRNLPQMSQTQDNVNLDSQSSQGTNEDEKVKFTVDNIDRITQSKNKGGEKWYKVKFKRHLNMKPVWSLAFNLPLDTINEFDVNYYQSGKRKKRRIRKVKDDEYVFRYDKQPQ